MKYYLTKYEPWCEKTSLWGFRSDLTQTGLCNQRRWLEAWNFRFRKKRDCSIQVAKRKALKLHLCFCICKKPVFSWHSSYLTCCWAVADTEGVQGVHSYFIFMGKSRKILGKIRVKNPPPPLVNLALFPEILDPPLLCCCTFTLKKRVYGSWFWKQNDAFWIIYLVLLSIINVTTTLELHAILLL